MTVATPYREAALKRLPVISPMAMKLVGKLARIEIDLGEVTRLIERDALLCGQILSTVNSARFGRSQTVNSISRAIGLLGTATLRKLALGFTVTNLFGRSKTAPEWSPLRFNLHSLAVAMLAENVANHVETEHRDSVFLAGILHDVGKYAIALNLHSEHTKIHELVTAENRPVVECERIVLGCDHAEISALMLERWEFPVYLREAVANHHTSDPPDPGQPVPLSAVLCTADRFVNSLGITVHQVSAESLTTDTLEMPGRDLPRREILTQFEYDYQELSELFR